MKRSVWFYVELAVLVGGLFLFVKKNFFNDFKIKL